MRIKSARLKKRHNLKGRIQQHESISADESAASYIKVDPKIFGASGYEQSSGNERILSATKATKKRRIAMAPSEKILSKRQRKALEKIVERKKKKEQRSNVIADLEKYKVDMQELDELVPVVALTRGAEPKRTLYETKKRDAKASKGGVRIRPVAGCRSVANSRLGKSINEMNLGPDSSDSEDDVEITEGEKNAEPSEDRVKNEPVEPVIENPTSCLSPDSGVVSPVNNSNVPETVIEISQEENMKSECKVSDETVPIATYTRKLNFKQVQRDSAIQESRLNLPILSEEHAIMEAISDNQVVIICGETGSGKTTQVPQFLYEAGYTEYGMIGVTEPRRVAAVAMSRRVAEEMSLTQTKGVSYVIRYEGTASEDTKIKFMTDGVLLKEVENDFLLMKYSAIVIDEAHERSIFTDILIGLLSRIVRLREKRNNPLKLIIMSATLRVDDFTSNQLLFLTPPPVIRIESRQYPVSIHFSRETPKDYMAEAFRKVCKIHREQPAGGILVFVTGQDEVHWLVSKLRATFGKSLISERETKKEFPTKVKDPYKSFNRPLKKKNWDNSDSDKPVLKALEVNLDKYSLNSEIDVVDHDEDSDTERPVNVDEREDTPGEQPMWVLPLYALLSTEKQQLVFQPAPDPNARLCVISTNVGETSLTIPNIRYVVDTGKVKTKLYDKVTGVSTFVVTWTSKASAVQRAGRAGRMGSGHCFRLYSSAVFTDMSQFSNPEIARRPVDDLILQMKAIGIDRVHNFPFPTPPSAESVKAAEMLLHKLGALEYDENLRSTRNESILRINDLGRLMARLPVSPRFSRIMCSAPDRKSLTYLIAMLAGLSVQELLLADNNGNDDDPKINSGKIRKARAAWSPPGEGRRLGDAGLFLRAIGAAEYSNATPAFCHVCGIRFKALVEARKIRKQLTSIVNALHPALNIDIDPQMTPPSDADSLELRRILLYGFGDRVAIRTDDSLTTAKIDESGKIQKVISKPGGCYDANGFDKMLTIHPSSVLYSERPPYVMFQDVIETSSSTSSSTTIYMKLVTAIDPKWLSSICSPFCDFGRIAEGFESGIEDLSPNWDSKTGSVMCHRKASYGTHNWDLGFAECEYPAGIDRIRWFARLFLEGKVIASLEQYVPVLLGAPLSVVKSWGRLQPRTELLIRTLYSKDVDSYSSLLEAWQEDSKFLLPAYLQWLPNSLHAQVTSCWPPIVLPAKSDEFGR